MAGRGVIEAIAEPSPIALLDEPLKPIFPEPEACSLSSGEQIPLSRRQ